MYTKVATIYLNNDDALFERRQMNITWTLQHVLLQVRYVLCMNDMKYELNVNILC